MKKLILVFLLPLSLISQINPVATDPTGSCVGFPGLQLNINAPGHLSACVSGVWTVINSGGGGGPSPYTLNPAMNGTASPGTSPLYSRGDHVHPSDVNKENNLGFPSVNGYILSSTTGGIRSWTPPSAGSSATWGSIAGTLSAQTDLGTALGLKANLASPTFTGVPLAPTAANGTNTTQIATTAFVLANAGGGGGASSLSQLTDFVPTSPSNNIVIAAGIHGFNLTQCNMSSASAGALTGSGGTGTGIVYLNPNCTIVMQYQNTLTFSSPTASGMTIQAMATPTYPIGSFPIATVAINTSTGVTSFADIRSLSTSSPVINGSGLVYAPSSGTMSVDFGTVPGLGNNNAFTGSNSFTGLATSCSGLVTGTIYNTTTSSTGGGTSLGVCP